jgi:hypothetical protein
MDMISSFHMKSHRAVALDCSRGIQQKQFLGGGTAYELRTKQNLVAELSMNGSGERGPVRQSHFVQLHREDKRQSQMARFARFANSGPRENS